MKQLFFAFLVIISAYAMESELLTFSKYHVIPIVFLGVKIYSEQSNYLNHALPAVDKLIRTGPSIANQLIMLGLSMSFTYDLLQGKKQFEQCVNYIDDVFFYALTLSVIKSFSHAIDQEDDYNCLAYHHLDNEKYYDMFKSFAFCVTVYALPPILLCKSFHKFFYRYNKRILLYFLYKKFL